MKCLSLILLTLSLSMLPKVLRAQENKLYDPQADGPEQIQQAMAKAQHEGKHVLVQIGGNWCSWCLLFFQFASTDTLFGPYLEANFVWTHLNYSQANQNEALLTQCQYPQRFGFPVFVVLDAQGNRLHTQNSVYLEKEEGRGYSAQKTLKFLQAWSPEALDPANYFRRK